MELTIIIPALNEAGNISELLRGVRERVGKKALSFELLVVDGGSKDDTVQKAENAGARVLRQKTPGYGDALARGFESAAGEYVLTMDADLSHPVEVFDVLWKNRSKYDLVIASRYVRGGRADMPFYRYVLSRALNFVFSKLLSVPVKDLSSGFRLYKGNLLKAMKIESRDFDVLEEILVKFITGGHKVGEVPFHYRPRKSGSSKARLFRFALSYLTTLGKMMSLKDSKPL